MESVLRILHLEDDPLDTELAQAVLESEGIAVDITRVETREEFMAALERGGFDLILADYSLPTFDGISALALTRERAPEIPFILLSGELPEEQAIEAVRDGAADFVVKQRIGRLGPSLEKALEGARDRAERQRAVAEREQAWKEVLRAKEEWERTFNAVPDLIAILDPGRRIVRANRAMADALGKSVEEVEGEWCCRWLQDRDEMHADCPHEHCLRDGCSHTVEIADAGHGRYFNVTVSPLFGPDGAVTGTVHVMRDITDRKRAEQELAEERRNLERTVDVRTEELYDSLEKLRTANARLLAAGRHKDRFLSSMSHELRTPLNAILGFADLLAGQFFGPLNDKQLGYVQQIDDGGKHLLALINDLLDVAKVDAGAMQLELGEQSVEELVHASLAMVAVEMRKKKLHPEIRVDPGVETIVVDPRRTKQVMLNLLSNAVKFTERGRIEVRTRKQGPWLRIEISDTGPGIPPSEQPMIFSEFHQADRVRDEQLGGTGIGLALSKRLVELHGGHIGVRSPSRLAGKGGGGPGSTFWFTLPLQVGSGTKADRQHAEEKTRAPVPGERKCILVAEDNDANRAMIVDMLRALGHQVLTARNGREAVDVARERRPDLILMDYRMPVMDGLEACRCLREMPEFDDVPILALTASVGSEAEERQIAAGCTSYLSKPIQSAELNAALERFL